MISIRGLYDLSFEMSICKFETLEDDPGRGSWVVRALIILALVASVTMHFFFACTVVLTTSWDKSRVD
jgi:hypothetical protein